MWVFLPHASSIQLGRTEIQRARTHAHCLALQTLYDIVLLGGLSGRLDHTVHVLSYLHKLRNSGRRIFAITDDNVGWVLDEAGPPPSPFPISS
jgi:thiamine pyrophosphokinase